MLHRRVWFPLVVLGVALLTAPRLVGQIAPLAPGGPEVTPDGGSKAVTQYTFKNTAGFIVLNDSDVSRTFTLTCSDLGNVTCESVEQSSVTLAAHASTDIAVDFSAGAVGTGRVTLTASGSGVDAGYYNVTISAPVGVSVTPDLTPVTLVANTTGHTQDFIVTNTSGASKTYTFMHSSLGQVTTTNVSPSSVVLAASASDTVTVTYNTGSIGSGKAILTAIATGARDQGSVDVTAVNSAPAVTLVVPSGAVRAVVRTRQPVVRGFFQQGSAALDTTATVLKWRGENVTHLARHQRGLLEWEVDSTRWLGVGDSALVELTACTTGGSPCTTVTRWAVLENDQKPILGFTGMPFEALGSGFSAPFGPGLSVSGAEVETGFSIPSYVSMGTPRSAGLVYSTRQSYPRVLVPVDLELPWPAGTPTQIALRLFDGAVKLDSLVLSNPICATGAVKRCRAVLQGDFSMGSFAAPTRKWLTVEAAVTSAGTTKSGTDSVEVVLVDRRSTRYGSGWWPAGVLQLIGAGNDRVLVGASGAATIYRGHGDSLYVAPPGNFTVLKKTGSGWELSPRGSLAKLMFDAAGRLVASVDQNGNSSSVAYQGATDRVEGFIDPVGKTISLSYNGSGKLTSFTDPGGRQSKVTINGTTNKLIYDSLSSPTGKGNSTTFVYREYPGTQTVVLFKRIGVILDTTIVTYDSTFKRRPERVRLPQVHDETGASVNPVIEYTPYERQGYGSLRSLDSVFVELKDPRDNWTRSLVNRWGQARKTWDKVGVLGRSEFDADGLMRWSEAKNGDSSRVYHDYDALRRLVRTWITRGGDVLRLDSLIYDANHRVVKRIDSRGRADSLKYDAKGNLTESRDSEGNVARTSYRSDGLVQTTTAAGETFSITYSYEATWKNLYQVTDEVGTLLATNRYDAWGRDSLSDRKVRIEKPGATPQWQWRRTEMHLNRANQADSTVLLRTGACANPCSTPAYTQRDSSFAQRVEYRFDRAGRDSLRRNNRIGSDTSSTLYLYDRLGRLLSRRPWAPDSSATVKDSMVYDVVGNLKTTITRRGDQITTNYDTRNRDTLTVIPGIGTIRQAFGGPQDQLTRVWIDTPTDSIGTVNGELRWGYDSRGRLKADTSYTGSTSRATTYTYDTHERPNTTTDPLGTWTTKYETIRGYPDTLLTPFGDSLTYAFDARSRPVGPTIRSNGPLESRIPGWRPNGELAGLTHLVGAAVRGKFVRNEVSDEDEGELPLGPVWYDRSTQWLDSVTYDGWERLTKWRTFRAGVLQATETYRFDRSGNINAFAGESYHLLTDRLLSRTANGHKYSYSYDRAGNQIQQRDSTLSSGAIVVWDYGYDALNRMRSVRRNGVVIARYGYDVMSRRIVKRVYSAASGGTAGYTRFVYHGDHVAFEADSAGSIGLRYTWGLEADDLVGVRDAAGNHYYAVQDKLGSVRGLGKRDGTWWMSQTFTPYGAFLSRDTTTSGAAVPLRYGWTGREYDAETGWYYFRARYYDPQQRRFVQEDPIGYNGGTNLYTYVGGRVLELRDPSGLYMKAPMDAKSGGGGPDDPQFLPDIDVYAVNGWGLGGGFGIPALPFTPGGPSYPDPIKSGGGGGSGGGQGGSCDILRNPNCNAVARRLPSDRRSTERCITAWSAAAISAAGDVVTFTGVGVALRYGALAYAGGVAARTFAQNAATRSLTTGAVVGSNAYLALGADAGLRVGSTWATSSATGALHSYGAGLGVSPVDFLPIIGTGFAIAEAVEICTH